MDLCATAFDVGLELAAYAKKPGSDQAQAIASLVSAASAMVEQVTNLHTALLRRHATAAEAAALSALKDELHKCVKARSRYPVLMLSTTSGNSLPGWAQSLELFPEPLSKPNSPTAHREQIHAYLRAFLKTVNSPADEFSAVDDDESDAVTEIALAAREGTSAFKRAVKKRFVLWMKCNHAHVVEDPQTSVGKATAQYLKNYGAKKGMKGLWAAFGELVKTEMRLVKTW